MSAGPPSGAPPRRIPAFDGIRGLALLFVICNHCALVPALGPLGVEIFFALSGFLIGGILLDTVGTPGWAWRFYSRRTLRIWPLYYVALLVLVVTDPFVHDRAGMNFGLLAVFLGNVAVLAPNVHRWGGVMWTVAVEEHFYLLVPAIVALVRRSWLPFVITAIAALSVACRYYVSGHYDHLVAYAITPCRLDGLALGVLGAWVVRNRPQWSRFMPPVAVVAFALEAYTLWTGPPMWERSGNRYVGYHITWETVAFWQMLSTFGTVAVLIAIHEGRMRWFERLLSIRVLRFYGTISYCAYLFHGLFIEIVNTHVLLPPPLRFLVVLAPSTALATLSWRYFEKPLLSRAPSSLAEINLRRPLTLQ